MTRGPLCCNGCGRKLPGVHGGAAHSMGFLKCSACARPDAPTAKPSVEKPPKGKLKR